MSDVTTCLNVTHQTGEWIHSVRYVVMSGVTTCLNVTHPTRRTLCPACRPLSPPGSNNRWVNIFCQVRRYMSHDAGVSLNVRSFCKGSEMWCHGMSAYGAMGRLISPCFLFQPVLHNWYNKGCGMCYPVCGMVLIKDSVAAYWKA